MVRVEDVTGQEIAKMHQEALYINDIVTSFGKNIHAELVTGSIGIWNKDPHVYIGCLKEDKSVFVLKHPDYLESVEDFGELYETRTGKELIIQTDYSSPSTDF